MPADAARPAGSSWSNRPRKRGTAAAGMLGQRLVTHQTGPQGRDVKRVYVEAASDIARELYLALSIDRASGRTTLIAAAEGGVEIEELAARAPDKILQTRDRPSHRHRAVPRRAASRSSSGSARPRSRR